MAALCLDRLMRFAECTGIAADWCPICGTCLCENRWRSPDQGCPLHADDSDHSALSAEPEHVQDAVDRLRQRQGRKPRE
jgi:hypothetical protein